MRTVKQRADKNPALKAHWTAGLDATFNDMKDVRVSEFKREIPGRKAPDHNVVMFVPGDESATTECYNHGETVLLPQYRIRQSDGSMVWQVYDRKLRRDVAVGRRDLSDRLLSHLVGL